MRVQKQRSVCFFVRLKDRSLLELIQWYKNDIRLLKDLGYKVITAVKFNEIPWRCDLYFSWWVTSSFYPLIKSKLMQKPIVVVAGGSEVVHLEEEPTVAAYQNKPLLVRQVIKYCLRHADKVICVSKSIKKEVDSLGAKDSIVVYHGIDTEFYKPQMSTVKDIIFTVSHFTENHLQRKRLLEIIEVAKYVLSEFPGIRFIIAGAKKENTVINKLQDRIRKAGLEHKVLLVQRISETEKLNLLARSALYLQPTLHEGFGVSIAEAMSCGVPVVTSKRAAVPEVVGDCGLYVDPYDVEDIAAKVLLLLRDKSLREELGKKSRERIVKFFSYEKRKENISKLLREILQE